jgi:hypothetical protein
MLSNYRPSKHDLSTTFFPKQNIFFQSIKIKSRDLFQCCIKRRRRRKKNSRVCVIWLKKEKMPYTVHTHTHTYGRYRRLGGVWEKGHAEKGGGMEMPNS